MIYIVIGNDNKKKKNYIKKICGDVLPILVEEKDLSKEYLLSLSSSCSLFSENIIFMIENFFQSDVVLSKEEIEEISNSDNIFILNEDKVLSQDINKYKKYSTIENFILVDRKVSPKNNVFDIALSFSKRDKLKTWVDYRSAILKGVSPEEISGIIFWKVKMMILSNTKTFSKEELKKISSRLIEVYHDSHLGKIDFAVGLEQFILTSLDK